MPVLRGQRAVNAVGHLAPGLVQRMAAQRELNMRAAFSGCGRSCTAAATKRLVAIGLHGFAPGGVQVARALGDAQLQRVGQQAQLARNVLVAGDVGIAGDKAALGQRVAAISSLTRSWGFRAGRACPRAGGAGAAARRRRRPAAAAAKPRHRSSAAGPLSGRPRAPAPHGEAKQLDVARVPGHQVQLLVHHHHALRQVLQAARDRPVSAWRAACTMWAVRNSWACCCRTVSSSWRLRWRSRARRRRWRRISTSSARASRPPAATAASGQHLATARVSCSRCSLQSLPGSSRVWPQQRPVLGGVLQAHHHAAAGYRALAAVQQGRQRLVGILARGGQLAAVLRRERVEQPVAPGVAAGEKDHAMGVRGEHGSRALRLLQLGEDDLHGHQAQGAPCASRMAVDRKRPGLPHWSGLCRRSAPGRAAAPAAHRGGSGSSRRRCCARRASSLAASARPSRAS